MSGEKFVDIVFDGTPSPEGAHFIEVETADGKSIPFAKWVQRDGGLWAIRLTPHADDLPHVHKAGTLAGLHIDTCARCGQDIRCSIHRAGGAA